MTDIKVQETEMSIAEYNMVEDTILFWDWTPENMRWYQGPDETFLEFVTRVIAHEEMHAVLNRLINFVAAWNYDQITNCDITELP